MIKIPVPQIYPYNFASYNTLYDFIVENKIKYISNHAHAKTLIKYMTITMEELGSYLRMTLITLQIIFFYIFKKNKKIQQFVQLHVFISCIQDCNRGNSGAKK